MADLPDANVWLALAWSGHAGHPVARAWWDSAAPNSICFCRVSQMALLRLLTNASVLGKDSKTQAGAWKIYDELRRSARVGFVDEPAGFEEQWRKLSSREVSATKKWTDDYLAALAPASGLGVIGSGGQTRTPCGARVVELLALRGVAPRRAAPRTEGDIRPVAHPTGRPLCAGWFGRSATKPTTGDRHFQSHPSGLRCVTFDEGFQSYAQLPVKLLVMPAPVAPPVS